MGQVPTFLVFGARMQVDLNKVKGLVEPILSQLGYELVDLRFLTEYGRSILRLFIEKEGGVTIGDCEVVSREIDTPLEIEGLLPGPYVLEVSTPGVDRPLVKESDFSRFAGRKAHIRLREPMDGRKNFKGRIQGVEGKEVLIEVDQQSYRIPLEAISRANLVFEGGTSK